MTSPLSTIAHPNGSSAEQTERLSIAVTGAGGTIGPALLDRLSAAGGIERITALGRHETADMRRHPDVEFRRLDVRDPGAAERAVAGSDVVVHMAFSLYGLGAGEAQLFATNVQGTVNVARAAARAGARRFVYTSSAAVYGASGDALLREDAPLRATTRLFYARHKAQAELMLDDELAETATELYLFRPCAIVGPHAAGALALGLPRGLLSGAGALARAAARVGLRPALPAPAVPLQFVHEDDVAQAITLATLGRGPAGAYNLAGNGVLSGAEVLATLGIRRLPLPRPAVTASLATMALTPPLVPALGWSELLREPLLVDTSKARKQLGWQPQWSSAAALHATRAAIGF